MSLGQQLNKLRTGLNWTQAQVGSALKVPRELVSMWENDTRKPNLRQLERLARLYDTTLDALLEKKVTACVQSRPDILLRGFDNASPALRAEIDQWLNFLDEWSEFLEPTEQLGRGQPPKQLDQGPDFSDIRSASKLASEMRGYFGLGLYALPDLYTFMDEHGILVCQAKLGPIGSGHEGISGAFYNHPKVGYSILINGETSRGRQMFTLAHEFAHAYFHYGVRGCIVSRDGEGSAREQFADAFASNFLVPGVGLRDFLREVGMPKQLDAHLVLLTAHYYNVSYAFMLNRLGSERLISTEDKTKWQALSPKSLAIQVGIEPELFRTRTGEEPYLKRYPSSVLKKIRTLIVQDEMYVSEAASLLQVDAITIQTELLQKPATATQEEVQETDEFANTYGNCAR